MGIFARRLKQDGRIDTRKAVLWVYIEVELNDPVTAELVVTVVSIICRNSR